MRAGPGRAGRSRTGWGGTVVRTQCGGFQASTSIHRTVFCPWTPWRRERSGETQQRKRSRIAQGARAARHLSVLWTVAFPPTRYRTEKSKSICHASEASAPAMVTGEPPPPRYTPTHTTSGAPSSHRWESVRGVWSLVGPAELWPLKKQNCMKKGTQIKSKSELSIRPMLTTIPR